MSKSSRDTEVFRFVCTRPAERDTRSIKIRRQSVIRPPSRSGDESPDDQPQSPSTSLFPSPFAAVSRGLKYNRQISALDALIGHESKLEIGRTIEVDAKLVRDSIRTVFSSSNLTNLVQSNEWKQDEVLIDFALFRLWQDGSDPQSLGPRVARCRQLYDLVRQAAGPTTGRDRGNPFYLRGLELESESDLATRSQSAQRDTDRARVAIRNVNPGTSKEDELKAKIRNLAEGLRMLNSSAILRYRILDEKAPFEFSISSDWIQGLTPSARDAVVAAGVTQPIPSSGRSIRDYYAILIAAIASVTAEVISSPEFRSGLFSVGPFNLEMVRPWTFPAGTAPAAPEIQLDIPAEKRSKIKPTGVADLLVVRDHVYKYVGGEIGAIQNVLRSEELIHETKRLDRTELVEFESTELQTEEEREESTATRFALSKEANEIIKKDSSLKVGVSTTAYGPYVSVKGDLSYAENNSTESSNKLASQFSQDITSRATSKIIQKTVRSTTRTTISEFQELNNHSFKNKDGPNISGVYQWVNKVSQCQMYNYGKRLLIDITIPEPAAFLMTQSGDAGPNLANPPPFTESAADLHEGNYSAIAARYQATGIKAPGDLLTSVSKSFKADIVGDLDAKPGTATSFHRGGMANVAMDVDVPVGYLAYSAKIQVGVRTGPQIKSWGPVDDIDDKIWPGNYNPPREPNTYVSVAGRLIKPGKVSASETDVIPSSDVPGTVTTPEALLENTAGVVIFDKNFHSGKIAVAIAQEFCLALSGTIYVCCVRDPVAFATWQQTTYEAIQTAYTKAAMDYERARSETAIRSLNVTSGNNPLENTAIISTELKKTAIAFITEQNFDVFGSVAANPLDGIPEVTDFDRAMKQGRYMDFFEQAFEWENLTYSLYPYFWAKRDTWRERMGFSSPDPAFSAFVKAGAAKVTVPARLGFGLEVIHMLDSGRIWAEGPVSTLATSEYYSVAQEILAAEADPQEVKVSAPWYTVIPTDLVKLRQDDELPSFKLDDKGVWVERKPGEKSDDEAEEDDQDEDEDED